ncbi:hypothetical protein FB561_2490 [Kribbella amoyensis]|uniref:Uncharacterized protein n=1 Tax=Kribbella amoyensis TaxID=996641 RepID=A0A561BR62_9ACTN|nr:hypothetical protein [Kribbella amoyensis]TWD81377.1 hypothetical protein FB561_2490 [Kribbella amoyensis]
MKLVDEFADLKTLDPAGTDFDPDGPRSRAMLERVLATDPAQDVRPARTRRRLVRVAVATSAIAIAAVAVFVPRESGPVPSGDEAYATWTAQPSGLSMKERADAVKQCRKSLNGMGQDDKLKQAVTAMAERRGDWALVVLTGPDQFAATCMTNVNPRNPQGYGTIDGPGRAPVGPRQLAASALGTSGGGNYGYLTSAIGRAGTDVVRMTYKSPVHGQVKATVQNGYFAFWVPGSEFDGLHPVPVQVTYRDGTTAMVALRLGS